MSHDASKVILGSTRSSARDGVEVFASDPATFKAGLAVRRNSSNLLSVAVGDGGWAGISLGKSLSDVSKTAVLAAGLGVPVLLEAGPARGVVEITDYANLVDTGNDTLKIGATTFTFKTSASTEGEVLCAASGSDNETVAAALAAKINAHSVAGLLFKASVDGAIVTITAKNNATAGSTIDLIYTDSGTDTDGLTVDDDTFTGGGTSADYVTVGSKVYFSNTTGKADDPNSDASVSDAVYVTGPITGIAEDGSEVSVAIVDMPGGL